MKIFAVWGWAAGIGLAASMVATDAGAQVVRDVNPVGPLESRPSFGGYYDVNRSRPRGASDLPSDSVARRDLESPRSAAGATSGRAKAADTCLAESRTARLTPSTKAMDALAACVRDNP